MENEFRREVFVLKPTSKEEKEKGKLRVGTYCRVSTDSEDQVHSFIAQVRYYNDFIRGREDMVLVEVYADDGIYNDRTIADRKKVSELRARRNKLLTDDEDEQCIDELRQLILYLESQPKAILSFNENIFNGVVERVTVEEDKLCFEIKSGILLKEVIAWN